VKLKEKTGKTEPEVQVISTVVRGVELGEDMVEEGMIRDRSTVQASLAVSRQRRGTATGIGRLCLPISNVSRCFDIYREVPVSKEWKARSLRVK
jgi:hypothetical protein